MLTVSVRTSGNPLVIANLLTTTKGERPDVTTERRDGCVVGRAGSVPFAFTTRPKFVYDAGELITDALAVTWSDKTVFAALATTISRGGALLVRSNEPITCEVTDEGMKYYLGAQDKVTLGLKAKPKVVMVNGKAAANAAYDDGRKTVTVELPKGEGEVRVEF